MALFPSVCGILVVAVGKSVAGRGDDTSPVAARFLAGSSAMSHRDHLVFLTSTTDFEPNVLLQATEKSRSFSQFRSDC